MTEPRVGSADWAAWVERLQEERDGLKGQLDRLEQFHLDATRELVQLRARAKAEDTAQATVTVIAEAELTNLRRNAGNLVSIVRSIINTPTTSRVDVQAKLTLAMQAFEREMGESWTG